MGNTWIMGDLHGCYKGLLQCLKRSNFDYENDRLIPIGDIVDGWSEVYECVEELLKIENLICLRGNHDEWFKTWLETGIHPVGWKNGGLSTLKSYGFNCLGKEYEKFQIKYDYKENSAKTNLNPGDIPESHIKFFRKQANYYIDDDRNLFVHGGFNRHFELKDQLEYTFYWDRDLWNSALSYESMNTKDKLKFKMKESFNRVFIGHTSTTNWSKRVEIMGNIISLKGHPTTVPMKAANIWNIDTGAGFKGKLTFFNLDTEEYIQSDMVQTLYPEEIGRN